MFHEALIGWSIKLFAASSFTNRNLTGSKLRFLFSLRATAPIFTIVDERKPLRSFSANG